MEIPQAIQEMADNLGVDVNALIANIEGAQHGQTGQQQTPVEVSHPADPSAAAAAAVGTGLPAGAAQAPGSSAEQAAPAETNEQRLERELAVNRQQLQQTQAQLQAHTSGGVVGNSGLTGNVPQASPTLAEIEPGIRFAVRNGMIPAEALREKFGDTIVELFLNDQGGVI